MLNGVINKVGKRQKPKYGFILVAGCSRAGAQIASTLSSQGKEVVVVDKDGTSFRKLSPDYSGFTIAGDVTDVDTLKYAGIAKADVLFAATDDDNVNVMVAQIAGRLFGCPKVITRLYDLDKEILYRDDNVAIIHPTKLTAKEFEKLMSQDIEEIDE